MHYKKQSYFALKIDIVWFEIQIEIPNLAIFSHKFRKKYPHIFLDIKHSYAIHTCDDLSN